MNKLYKPNGQEMYVNDDSLKHALSLGWKKSPVEQVKPKKLKKADDNGNG